MSESVKQPSEEKESALRKFKRLLIPILAWVCEIVGSIPVLLSMFPFGGEYIDVSWPFQFVGSLIIIVGLGLAIAGICLRKKTGMAGIVLSVLALCNPIVYIGLFCGTLYTSIILFGM